MRSPPTRSPGVISGRRRGGAGRHPRRRDGQGLRDRAHRHVRRARRRRGRGAGPPRGPRPGAGQPQRGRPDRGRRRASPRWTSWPRTRPPRRACGRWPPPARSTPISWRRRPTPTPPPRRTSQTAEPTATLLSNADGQPVSSAADAMSQAGGPADPAGALGSVHRDAASTRTSPRSSSSRPPGALAGIAKRELRGIADARRQVPRRPGRADRALAGRGPGGVTPGP